MSSALSIQILGKLKAGVFSPCPVQSCSYFQGDRVAIGSRECGIPALVLHDSTVSPKHAMILQQEQGWVVLDLDSDNGLRSIHLLPGTDLRVEQGAPSLRLEFSHDLCCSVGAVVLRIRVASAPRL